MRKILTLAAGLALMTSAVAGDMATPDEAKAMSQKAQAAVNEMGSEKAFIVFADAAGGFQE